jgi:tripartite-type tricarboxylate transporter receptor subunit TctC
MARVVNTIAMQVTSTLATLLAATAALVLCAFVADAAAQTYPLDKPIRFVVPYPPGGSADSVTRLLAQHLGPRLGKPVVVENLSGAGGNIGTNNVVRSAPDGHSLVLAATPLTTNPSFYKDIPFDVLKDVTPIALLMRQQFVLVVHPSVPAKSVEELIALAKTNPKALSFASHSAGGATHLAGELFKVMAGIELLHVPYKGSAPANADLVAGVVSMLFDSAATAMPQVEAGRLRALATTGPTRTPLVAKGMLPTMGEIKGLEGFNVVAWYGVMGPAGMPPAIVERLNRELNAIVHMPEVTARLNAMGFEVVSSTPKEFAQHVRTEVDKWAKVVRESGARLE